MFLRPTRMIVGCGRSRVWDGWSEGVGKLELFGGQSSRGRVERSGMDGRVERSGREVGMDGRCQASGRNLLLLVEGRRSGWTIG